MENEGRKKECKRCGELKHIHEFAKSGVAADRRHIYCRDCCAAIHKERKVLLLKGHTQTGLCVWCGHVRPLISFPRGIGKNDKNKICKGCSKSKDQQLALLSTTQQPQQRCKKCGEDKPATFEYYQKKINGELFAVCRSCTVTAMTEGKRAKKLSSDAPMPVPPPSTNIEYDKNATHIVSAIREDSNKANITAEGIIKQIKYMKLQERKLLFTVLDLIRDELLNTGGDK
jgi:hypothetical protein